MIAPEKLRDYLLDEAHPDNKGKVRLFEALGYRREDWEQLANDLREQHLTKDAIDEGEGPWGHNWRIEALLVGPSGRARIRSAWVIRAGHEEPSFVTAYGLKR